MPLLLSWLRPCGGRGQAEVPGPFLVGRRWPSFSRGPAVFTAILVIEFIYAIVGIVWLTQYYTSCNDLTAKNVTLGMPASPGAEGREERRLGHHQREAVSVRGCGLPPCGPPPTSGGPWSGGGSRHRAARATFEGPSASHWKPTEPPARSQGWALGGRGAAGGRPRGRSLEQG